MPPVGFESTISAGERSQTYALDRAATGTCITYFLSTNYILCEGTEKQQKTWEHTAPT